MYPCTCVVVLKVSKYIKSIGYFKFFSKILDSHILIYVIILGQIYDIFDFDSELYIIGNDPKKTKQN